MGTKVEQLFSASGLQKPELTRLIFGYLPPTAITSLEEFHTESQRNSRIVTKDAVILMAYLLGLIGNLILVSADGARINQGIVLTAMMAEYAGMAGTAVKILVDVGNYSRLSNRGYELEQAAARNAAMTEVMQRYPGIPHKTAKLLGESSYQSQQELNNSKYWSDPNVRMGINSLFHDAVALLRMQDVDNHPQGWQVGIRERLENSAVDQSLDRPNTWTPERVMDAISIINQTNIRAVNLFHGLELPDLADRLPVGIQSHELIRARTDIISFARGMRMAYKQTQEVATRLNVNGIN